MNAYDITRIFRKCQIPKSKLLTKNVDFKNRTHMVCHEAVILSWRRGLYKYLQLQKYDEENIIGIVNKILPINSKKCLLDFSKYLIKTNYWQIFYKNKK